MPPAPNFWRPTSGLTTFTANLFTQFSRPIIGWLNASAQESAARASLDNAQAVQQAAEERLKNGLATLPDVLEERSATARAQYDLQALLGAEQNAQGDLATALGASAYSHIRVQPFSAIAAPETLGDTTEQVIDRAIAQRPDLQAEVAGVREANAQQKEARASFYPSFGVTVAPVGQSLYLQQQSLAWGHTADLTGEAALSLNWNVFDTTSVVESIAAANPR